MHPPLPEFYDDLAACEQFAWQMLTQAADERGLALRHLTLATNGRDGWPQVRTIVVREVAIQSRSVYFQTDARATKVAEMLADPRVALIGYDPRINLQLTLHGQCRMHQADGVAQRHWREASTYSKRSYFTDALPNTATATPKDGLVLPATVEELDAAQDAAAYRNFTVAEVVVGQMEWLYLHPAGHRRARFDYSGQTTATWLIP